MISAFFFAASAFLGAAFGEDFSFKTFFFMVLHFEFPTMIDFNNFFGNGQTETGTFFTFCGEERFENARYCFGRHAESAIAQHETKYIVGLKTKTPDLTAADLDAAVRTVAGSARSMGVEVEGFKHG